MRRELPRISGSVRFCRNRAEHAAGVLRGLGPAGGGWRPVSLESGQMDTTPSDPAIPAHSAAGRSTTIAPSAAGGLLTLFALSILLGASLIFFVEPMFAKMVLPLLGGSPAVWNTCVVYFQALLLVGYLYAHLLTTKLTHRRQVVVHATLLLACGLALPVALPPTWTPPGDGSPVLWLTGVLTVSLAAPFFVVASTGPLLQGWFSRSDHHSARDPYFLYSASNLGSLLALLAYPLLVERWWSLSAQSVIWTTGYVLLATAVLACGVAVSRGTDIPAPTNTRIDPAEVLSWRRRAKWMALAFVPSSLMLGVTTYMSTDIAAAPLLWVVPLALYLLSFVAAFARRQILPQTLVRKVTVTAILLVTLTISAGLSRPVIVLIPLHLCAFFLAALASHSTLAADRPGPARVTEFYLWVAVGGVLGGLFNTLLAPLVFSTGILEYPSALVLACLLPPHKGASRVPAVKTEAFMLAAAAVSALVIGAFLRGQIQNTTVVIVCLALTLPYFVLSARPVSLTAAVALFVVAGAAGQLRSGELLRERTFFGIYKVSIDKKANIHRVVHGSTVHGEQSLDPAAAHRPSSYYSGDGPIGQAFQALGPRLDGADIGVVGLGAGALAGYARAGQHWTFYEIDPAVQRIASAPQYFTFLRDCGDVCRVTLGDARLSIRRGGQRHDLLVLDAFSSDAIPLHLITREAVELYFNHLSVDGVVAFHISNRHLNLGPVLAAIAFDLGFATIFQFDPVTAPGHAASEWLLMARSNASFGPLTSDRRWIVPERASHAWTDASSNILSALR